MLWAILPVTLAIVGLALTGVYTHQQAMQDFVIQRDRLLAWMIALRLQDALAYGEISPDGTDLGQWLPLAAEDLPGGVLVIDGTGRVLARSAQEGPANVLDEPGIRQALRQQTGAVVVDAGTPSLILSFADVPGTDWQVIVRAQVAELVGPILRLSSFGPIAAVIAGALSLLMLTFGWRTIAHPLQQLSQAASEVFGGHHAAIHQKIEGVTEVEELHHALTEMVERLEGYQAGVLDYVDAMTKGQEEERARLARELHDGPVQSLIAMNQRLEMASQKIASGDGGNSVGSLEQLRAAGVKVIEDLRRIIGALRPAYLEDLGFVPALDVLVRSANARTDAQVMLRVGKGERRLTPDVELAAYRITQEALNNALQHADAEHITVTVRYDEDEVALEIADDGIGFGPAVRLDSYTREGHFGLVGLQERARHLGGSLSVDSQVGRGTIVQVRLPDRCALEPCPA